jgi:hypothetical protein
MRGWQLSRFGVGLLVALIGFATPRASADLIVTVNDLQVFRIAGDLGIDQSRMMPATDLQVADGIVFRGFRVESQNFGGTGGSLQVFIDQEEYSGQALLVARVNVEETLASLAGPSRLVAVHDTEGTIHFTALDQAYSFSQLASVDGPDLPPVGGRVARQDIDVDTFRFGASSPPTIVAGSGAEKVTVLDLSFTKTTDQASPKLTVTTTNSRSGVSASAVPEPSAVTLLAIGAASVAACGALRRRRAG